MVTRQWVPFSTKACFNTPISTPLDPYPRPTLAASQTGKDTLMKIESYTIFALLTAACWGIGGYFEKKGLALGHLSPQMGITIRTGVALLVLAVASYPYWKTLPQAGPKAMLYMVLGGGILAGSAGMLCFYMAIKGSPTLGKVMPIAFTSPLFGALMGILLGGEPVSVKTILGMLLTVGGIIVLTL